MIKFYVHMHKPYILMPGHILKMAYCDHWQCADKTENGSYTLFLYS